MSNKPPHKKIDPNSIPLGELAKQAANRPKPDTSGDGEQRSTEQVILTEITRVFEPAVVAARRGPEDVEQLLTASGIGPALFDDAGFSELVSTLEAVAEAFEGLEAAFESGGPDVEEIQPLFEDVKTIVEEFGTLDDIDIDSQDVDAAGERLLDYLLIEYLDSYHANVHAFLVVGGIIVQREDKPDDLAIGKLPDLLTDVGTMPAEVLDWGTQAFDPVILLYYLREVLWKMGLPAATGQPEPSGLASLSDMAEGDVRGAAPRELAIPVLSVDGGVVGLRLVPLPGTQGGDLPGLALVPYGMASVELGTEVDLGDDWTFAADLTGSGSIGGWGLAVRPTDSGLSAKLRDLKQGSNIDAHVEASAELAYTGATEDGEKTTLLGDPDATRLALGSLAAKTRLEYDGQKTVFEFGVPVSGTFAIDTADGDGFLQKVLPPDGITYDFETLVGWSSERGLFFEQGGTLEASLALNASLGPLTMREMHLAIASAATTEGEGGSGGSGPPAFELPVAGSMSLDIGFLTATVKRIGVTADVTFPKDRNGNVGPLDVVVGFKPPNGIGLEIDAGPVSGGGVINFYPDEHRYSGALQLQFGEYTLTAIALLKTKLPGGKDGYSFLLLITAELPPIQLGFGFTLTGVGGMFGLHRKFKSKPLGKAVRTGHVDSVLFPEDVVENAQRIISDLRSFFPPTKGQHVVGPMVQLNWGTPKLLTMEVGVILQIPRFKIGLVGNFTLVLPDEEAALVEINLAVLGVLDPPNKRLSIDASLYDSRIVMWSVSGDMAMRLRWGSDSRFMLSVGGFHPRYDAPSSFPKLDRVKATFSPPGGNPRLEYKGYLATTPNTFQVGAGVYLHAEAGPLVVDGELSFDALFEFNPFKFVIDFLAKLAITFKGHGLDIRVEGTLKGPNPFHVTGTVHIEILCISVTANVDVTIGKSKGKEKLPTATILPQLRKELAKPGNWSAQLPEGGATLVSIRQSETASTDGQSNGEDESTDESDEGPSKVLAHPLGGISVRQTLVPLGQSIEKFGNARPATHDTFRIAEISVDGEELESTEKNREKFSPAQFTKMSDSEKLSSPAFVEREAGQRASDDRIYYGGEPVDGEERADWRTTAKLTYETAVIDERREQPSSPLGSLGGFATGRPELARVGVPAVKIPRLLPRSAVGRTEAEIRGGFTDGGPEVYGVPGGKTIGERRESLGGRDWGPTTQTTPDQMGGETTKPGDGSVFGEGIGFGKGYGFGEESESGAGVWEGVETDDATTQPGTQTQPTTALDESAVDGMQTEVAAGVDEQGLLSTNGEGGVTNFGGGGT